MHHRQSSTVFTPSKKYPHRHLQTFVCLSLLSVHAFRFQTHLLSLHLQFGFPFYLTLHPTYKKYIHLLPHSCVPHVPPISYSWCENLDNIFRSVKLISLFIMQRCWLSAVSSRAAGYVSGMREAARAVSLIPDTQPAALHLTADHQQPRHYTPYAVIKQV